MGCNASIQQQQEGPAVVSPAKLQRQESLGTAIGFTEYNQSLNDIFIDIFNVDLIEGRRLQSVKREKNISSEVNDNSGEEKETSTIEANASTTRPEEADPKSQMKEDEEANNSQRGVVTTLLSKIKTMRKSSDSKEPSKVNEPRISMTPNSLAPLPEGFSPAQSEEYQEKEATAKEYINIINDVEEGDGTGLMAPIAGLIDTHKYASQKDSSKVTKMKPFMKELTRKLPKNLKADPNGCIFVRFDEDRPSFLKAIITGVTGTPYENGCFLFDIHCPNNYPNTNPAVTHTTPGAGSVTANNGPGGFSPNLHKGTGKVCLSLLGTWSGQGWDKDKHSIYTVLSSIMWGILGAEHPYYNEPGHGGWEGTAPTKGHDAKVIEYDSRVMVGTCRYAIANMIKNPPTGFENVIRAHFNAKRSEILETMKLWGKACNKANKSQLQAAIKEVELALDTL